MQEGARRLWRVRRLCPFCDLRYPSAPLLWLNMEIKPVRQSRAGLTCLRHRHLNTTVYTRWARRVTPPSVLGCCLSHSSVAYSCGVPSIGRVRLLERASGAAESLRASARLRRPPCARRSLRSLSEPPPRAMDSLVDPVAELREDPLLAPVVAPDFDAAKFSREIIGGRVQPKGAEGGAGGAGGSGSTVADVGGGGGVARAAPDEVLRRVGARLRSVDARVRQLVGAHQDDLLAQAGRTRELKEEVDGVAERASDLRARVDSVRESVLGPLAQIRAHADRLERLQEAAGLVRGVMRFQFAVRKLRGVLGDRDAATLDPRELAKASHILMEAEAVLQFGDDGAAGASDEASKGPPKLQGIDVVDRERAWLASTGVGLRERAHELLLASMESLSQADLGSALHIFFELHCLPERVDAAIAHAVDTVKRAAGTAFDVAALAASVGGGGATGRAGDSGAAAGSSGPRSRGSRLPGKLRGNLTPPPGAAPAWRAALWSRVDALLERL